MASGYPGYGQAQVLGKQRDPLGEYVQGKKTAASQEIAKGKVEIMRRKQSDTEALKTLSHKYVDPGKRFQYWGQKTINDTQQGVLGLLNNNPDVDISQLRPAISQLQGGADERLALASQLNELYDQQLEYGKSNKMINQARYKELADQAISKENPEEVDQEFLGNIDKLPEVYDKHAIISDSINRWKAPLYQTSDFSNLKTTPLGQYWTIKDNNFVFGRRGEDGSITPGISDEHLSYLLGGNEITPEGRNQKVVGNQLNDVYRWDIAKRQAQNPQDMQEVNAIFRKIQYDPAYNGQVAEQLRGDLENNYQRIQSREKIQSAGKFRQANPNAKISAEDYDDRRVTLNALLNPNNDPEATQVALNRLKTGEKIGGKPITDVVITKGGMAYTPEQMQRFGNALLSGGTFTEKPAKQVNSNSSVVTIKTGSMFGEPVTQPISIDLSLPGADAVLNQILNTSKGEKKILYKDILQQQQGNNTYLDEEQQETEEDSGYLDEP